MKLDLNFPFTDIYGIQLTHNGQPSTIGRNLAGFLAGDTKGDPVKYMNWALLLHDNKPIEIDESDKEKLKEFVTYHPQMSNILKYPIIKIIINLKP